MKGNREFRSERQGNKRCRTDAEETCSAGSSKGMEDRTMVESGAEKRDKRHQDVQQGGALPTLVSKDRLGKKWMEVP